jgi:hypothetical protein
LLGVGVERELPNEGSLNPVTGPCSLEGVWRSLPANRVRTVTVTGAGKIIASELPIHSSLVFTVSLPASSTLASTVGLSALGDHWPTACVGSRVKSQRVVYEKAGCGSSRINLC